MVRGKRVAAARTSASGCKVQGQRLAEQARQDGPQGSRSRHMQSRYEYEMMLLGSGESVGGGGADAQR